MPPPSIMGGIGSLFGMRSSQAEISDDEISEVSQEEVPYKPGPKAKAEKVEKKAKKPVPVEEEPLAVESDGDQDEDDDDIGEDVYVVEAITDHSLDEHGNIFFEVKWEGYEKKSERTMEPEENLLETAKTIVEEYLAKIGGREALMEAWEKKKNASKKGKKRGRSSTATESNGANGVKRERKSHPADSSPPAGAKSVEFKPPTGSWEEEVTGIDACEGAEGDVVVYLTWKGGQKSQHPLAQVYKRCPQKMLKFYESHLVFKKNDDTA